MSNGHGDFASIERRLSRGLARAVTDFGMLADGDRVMVCVSGGKDSYTMLHLLRELAKKAPIEFELVVASPGLDRVLHRGRPRAACSHRTPSVPDTLTTDHGGSIATAPPASE